MTLILGIPAKDGIVLASDGQVTFGAVRAPATKIYQLNSYSLWSASGELALIQRVAEHLNTLPDREQPLINLRDFLAQAIKTSVEQLLNLDFRTKFASGNPDSLLRLHPGDFIFAEYREQPRLLHITINGTPEWICGRPIASGSGDLFAYALLRKYQGLQLDVQMASLLAFKVIEETIQVGAYGLGPPIDIWRITQNGIHHCQEDEIAALEDLARAVREEEINIFISRFQQCEEPIVMPSAEGVEQCDQGIETQTTQ